jgi:hypothetical protein
VYTGSWSSGDPGIRLGEVVWDAGSGYWLGPCIGETDYLNWHWLHRWNYAETPAQYAADGGAYMLGPKHLYALSSVITAVPEPSTFILFSITALGALAYAWRRRKTTE